MRQLAFLILAIAVVGSCSQHDDPPPAIGPPEVTFSPTPESFTVATTNDIIYTLSWTTSQPTTVAYYNLYTQNPFTGEPLFQDSTTTTSAQVDTQIPTPDIVFGVASVSVDNVESALTFASAP